MEDERAAIVESTLSVGRNATLTLGTDAVIVLGTVGPFHVPPETLADLFSFADEGIHDTAARRFSCCGLIPES